jgi:hypothetical protein
MNILLIVVSSISLLLSFLFIDSYLSSLLFLAFSLLLCLVLLFRLKVYSYIPRLDILFALSTLVLMLPRAYVIVSDLNLVTLGGASKDSVMYSLLGISSTVIIFSYVYALSAAWLSNRSNQFSLHAVTYRTSATAFQLVIYSIIFSFLIIAQIRLGSLGGLHESFFYDKRNIEAAQVGGLGTVSSLFPAVLTISIVNLVTKQCHRIVLIPLLILIGVQLFVLGRRVDIFYSLIISISMLAPFVQQRMSSSAFNLKKFLRFCLIAFISTSFLLFLFVNVLASRLVLQQGKLRYPLADLITYPILDVTSSLDPSFYSSTVDSVNRISQLYLLIPSSLRPQDAIYAIDSSRLDVINFKLLNSSKIKNISGWPGSFWPEYTSRFGLFNGWFLSLWFAICLPLIFCKIPFSSLSFLNLQILSFSILYLFLIFFKDGELLLGMVNSIKVYLLLYCVLLFSRILSGLSTKKSFNTKQFN